MVLLPVLQAVAAEYDLYQGDRPIGVEYVERQQDPSGVRYSSRSRFVLEEVLFVVNDSREFKPFEATFQEGV